MQLARQYAHFSKELGAMNFRPAALWTLSWKRSSFCRGYSESVVLMKSDEPIVNSHSSVAHAKSRHCAQQRVSFTEWATCPADFENVTEAGLNLSKERAI